MRRWRAVTNGTLAWGDLDNDGAFRPGAEWRGLGRADLPQPGGRPIRARRHGAAFARFRSCGPGDVDNDGRWTFWFRVMGRLPGAGAAESRRVRVRELRLERDRRPAAKATPGATGDNDGDFDLLVTGGPTANGHAAVSEQRPRHAHRTPARDRRACRPGWQRGATTTTTAGSISSSPATTRAARRWRGSTTMTARARSATRRSHCRNSVAATLLGRLRQRRPAGRAAVRARRDASTYTRLYHNTGLPANSPPAPPTNLTVVTNSQEATFSWSAAADAQQTGGLTTISASAPPPAEPMCCRRWPT